MKNVIKLSALVLSIAGLASCSTLGIGSDDNSANSADQQAATTQASTDTGAKSVATNATAPTAKIKLKKNSSDQIVATITTNYNNNPQGSVKLQWKAPKDSKCYDTSFPITKYGEKNDKTHASVEIKQGKMYCNGTWTANVVYDNDVIASDSVTV